MDFFYIQHLREDMMKFLMQGAFITMAYIGSYAQSGFDRARLMSRFNADTILYFLNRHPADLDNSLVVDESLSIDSVLYYHRRKLAKIFLSSSGIVTVSMRSIMDSVRHTDSLKVLAVVDGILLEDTTGVLIDPSVIKSVEILKPDKTWIFCSPPRIFLLITTNENWLGRSRRKRGR